MFIEDVILYCFKSGEVMRYSTLYHLLKGKKTTSVLSYGKLYTLLDYFCLFPKLSKPQFNSSIHSLIQKGHLQQMDSQLVKITNQGKDILKYNVLSQLSIKGFHFYKYDDVFWQRLLFVSQVISYKSYQNADYLPIDNDPIHQLQVKQWLFQHNSDQLVKEFFSEWEQLIKHLTEEEQDMLVGQLVGHEVVGYTLSQLALQKNYDKVYAYLLYKSALHKMLIQINDSCDYYILMNSLVDMVEKEKEQDTVDLTDYLLSKGHTIKQVAHMRRLKESTIMDHFIEINMSKPSDEYMSYIPKEVCQHLEDYLKEYPNYKSWKYSQVVSKIPTLTFYEFKFYQFYLWEKKGGK